jgi:hypothetical protein
LPGAASEVNVTENHDSYAFVITRDSSNCMLTNFGYDKIRRVTWGKPKPSFIMRTLIKHNATTVYSFWRNIDNSMFQTLTLRHDDARYNFAMIK